MTRQSLAWLAALGLGALACGWPRAWSDEQNLGVTVTGWGQAMVRPELLELHVKLAGNGRLGTDALARFQRYRQELAEMIGALGAERIELSTGGISITPSGDPNTYWQTLAPGGQPEVAELAVSCICRITISGLAELSDQQVVELTSTLIDKLRDSGLVLLPAQQALALEPGAANDVYAAPALVGFVVEDFAAARARARQAAFKDAQASAEALAKLAGLRLGPVLAVTEVASGTAPAVFSAPLDEEWQDMLEVDVPEGEVHPSHGRLVSRTSGPVPIRVGLQVRFGLLAANDNDEEAPDEGAAGTDGGGRSARTGSRPPQPQRARLVGATRNRGMVSTARAGGGEATHRDRGSERP